VRTCGVPRPTNHREASSEVERLSWNIPSWNVGCCGTTSWNVPGWNVRAGTPPARAGTWRSLGVYSLALHARRLSQHGAHGEDGAVRAIGTPSSLIASGRVSARQRRACFRLGGARCSPPQPTRGARRMFARIFLRRAPSSRSGGGCPTPCPIPGIAARMRRPRHPGSRPDRLARTTILDNRRTPGPNAGRSSPIPPNGAVLKDRWQGTGTNPFAVDDQFAVNAERSDAHDRASGRAAPD
jgi:hypothetical protein